MSVKEINCDNDLIAHKWHQLFDNARIRVFVFDMRTKRVSWYGTFWDNSFVGIYAPVRQCCQNTLMIYKQILYKMERIRQELENMWQEISFNSLEYYLFVPIHVNKLLSNVKTFSSFIPGKKSERAIRKHYLTRDWWGTLFTFLTIFLFQMSFPGTSIKSCSIHHVFRYSLY